MSYTDDRDDLAELLGLEPKSKSGYSEEISDTPSSTPGPKGTPSREALPEPREKVGVKTPVKLRPPEHLDVPLPVTPAPAPAKSQPPPRQESVIEDEEMPIYDSSPPDLSELDLVPLDKETARQSIRRKEAPTKQPAASKQSAATPSPPPARATPQRQEQTPPQPEASIVAREAAAPQPAAGKVPEKTVTTSEPAAPGSAARDDSPFAEGRGKPTSDKLLLDTQGLVKIYDGRTVVNGVDINVRPGEIVGLLGPNGAGKTTSFYMIVGLVPPNGGRVLFNGADVTQEPMYQRARLGMGYLPQEESIFRKLTVEENIMAVMETLPISKKERQSRCDELLERFSITHIRKNVALTCSGGEKRRLTIARSLVTQPSLLMLDEPFSGVDPIAVNEIQTIVEDLRKSGLAILITDHNARQTLELVDRAYLIYEGKVLREGSRDFLINDPVSRELYLGDRFTM